MTSSGRMLASAISVEAQRGPPQPLAAGSAETQISIKAATSNTSTRIPIPADRISGSIVVR